MTPLMDATRGDHVTTTEFLLYECGVSQCQLCCKLHYKRVLILATYFSLSLPLSLFLLLCSFPKANLDAEDILGRKAIHHASQAGAVGSLRCIITAGADVNQPASINNITPLHYAAKVMQIGQLRGHFST